MNLKSKKSLCLKWTFTDGLVLIIKLFRYLQITPRLRENPYRNDKFKGKFKIDMIIIN